MAGLGFSTSTGNTQQNGPRKPMGIQFVKSGDTVGSVQPPLSTMSSLDQSSTSKTTPCIDAIAGSNAVSYPGVIPSLMNCPTGPPTGQTRAFDPGKPVASNQYGRTFVKSGEAYSSFQHNSFSTGRGYKMPGQSNFNKFGGTKPPISPVDTFENVKAAQPVCSKDEYMLAWKQEKDADIAKLRKLAYEVVSLKSDRPNAKDKLHSAANRVPLRIEFNTEPVFGPKGSNSFLCYVFVEGVSIASGQGAKIKDAKTNAYEAALQKMLMPHLRIVQVDPNTKELQVSKQPFTSPPKEPSAVPLRKNPGFSAPGSTNPDDASKSLQSVGQHKESNLEAAGLKRRYNEYKPLDEFVIVEPFVPIQDCTAAHTLRRSADFNHMLLEYEYFFKGEAARCILRLENEILADVNGVSKAVAKNTASVQALLKLKKFCWVIKTKQQVDSNTKISKDEMLNELNDQSDSISQDNIGNKLLRKMGWSGGGVGKDGSGIAEPVSLKSVLNREGLGLSATKGITDEFRRKIKEVVENYAASNNQEDLVFSNDFRLEERQIIHDECRRLNLRSKSRGKGLKRQLWVRRKRSVNQLCEHLMSVGGETVRYLLVPPGNNSVNGPSGFGNAPSSQGSCVQPMTPQNGAAAGNVSQPVFGAPALNRQGASIQFNNGGPNFPQSHSSGNDNPGSFQSQTNRVSCDFGNRGQYRGHGNAQSNFQSQSQSAPNTFGRTPYSNTSNMASESQPRGFNGAGMNFRPNATNNPRFQSAPRSTSNRFQFQQNQANSYRPNNAFSQEGDAFQNHSNGTTMQPGMRMPMGGYHNNSQQAQPSMAQGQSAPSWNAPNNNINNSNNNNNGNFYNQGNQTQYGTGMGMGYYGNGHNVQQQGMFSAGDYRGDGQWQ